MPHDVKMPQLGMTQDSGVIVSWLKAHGDKVAVGDALFEVETDKATMEVEAASDGFLAGMRATEGDDVPVGDLIAVIVETEDAVADFASGQTGAERPMVTGETEAKETGSDPNAEPANPQEDQTAQTEPSTETTPLAIPVSAPSKVAPVRGQKILASPKAKRLAKERGLDLVLLKAQGAREPIHAGDLEHASAGGQSTIAARVPGAALNALLDRSENPDRTGLFAAFAAGAWRALFETDNVAVLVRGLDGNTTAISNPYRGRTGSAEQPAMSLVDLCDTRLTAFAAAGGVTSLSAARDGDDFVLTLAFSEGTLALPLAIALLEQIAARVEDPIRQLL